MNTLPSFVELMASLGLDSHSSQPSPRQGSASHSRSSSLSSTISFPDSEASSNVSLPPQSDIYSNASPSIVISNIDGSPPTRARVPERRRSPGRIARYSPYGPPISHTRKGSSASATTDEEACDRPIRRMQSSPFLSSSLSSSDTAPRRHTTYAERMANKRPDKLTLSGGDFTATTPISSFVRRKTPSASPTTPEFAIRNKRRRSPAPPMSIPTLPFVFPPSPTYASFDSDVEDDDMDDSFQSKPKSHLAAQPRKVIPDAPPLYNSNGVRITAFSRPSSRLDDRSHLASVTAA